MSNTGTDIRVKAFPRMTNAQIAAIAGDPLAHPAGGLVIDGSHRREMRPTVGASDAVIPTRWLDDTPAFQEEIIEDERTPRGDLVVHPHGRDPAQRHEPHERTRDCWLPPQPGGSSGLVALEPDPDGQALTIRGAALAAGCREVGPAARAMSGPVDPLCDLTEIWPSPMVFWTHEDHPEPRRSADAYREEDRGGARDNPDPGDRGGYPRRGFAPSG